MSGTYDFAPELLSEDCRTAIPGVALSRLRPDDAAAMAEGLNDLDVSRNLIAVPNPYAAEDARVFLRGPGASPHMLCAALRIDGAFAGCVAIDATAGPAELGYWLAKPYWGRGIMSAATRSIVDLAFAATDLDRIVSGHFVDNHASAAVLKKLGFKTSGVIETRSRARAETVRLVAMTLEREAWAPRRPSIGTARLTMRCPTLADVDDMAALAVEGGLPLTTVAIPDIRRRADARTFLTAAARRSFPDEASFCMRLRETDALVGGIGWRRTAPNELELGYWLGADHRGVGLATEAARAALDAAFEATGVASIKACCRVTNSASRGVLERCGFQWAGAGHMRTQGQGGPAPVDRFRVDREVFYSLKSWGAAVASGAA